jgi:hypothetical protein
MTLRAPTAAATTTTWSSRRLETETSIRAARGFSAFSPLKRPLPKAPSRWNWKPNTVRHTRAHLTKRLKLRLVSG